FSNIDVVDGLGGDDTLTAGADHTWNLNGNDNSLTQSGVTYTNIEIATSLNSNVQGIDDAVDRFEVSVATGEITANDIYFHSVDSVDGGSGIAIDVVSSDVSQNWSLNGDSGSVEAKGIVFADVEQANTTMGFSTIAGSSSSDTYDVTGQGANSIEANDVAFNNITSVAAGAGSSDVIVSTEVEAWQLTSGLSQIEQDGISYTGLEQANGAAGSSVLGTAADDTFIVHADPNKIEQDGLVFSNIDVVDGLGGDDTLTAGDDHTWNLNGNDNSLTQSGVTYSNIEIADALNANIQGRNDAVDVFEISSVDNEVMADGISFVNVDSVDGGDGVQKDVIDSDVSQDWELDGNDYAVQARGISFGDVEVANTTSGVSSITGSLGNDSFLVAAVAQHQVQANGIEFSEVASVDAVGGNDSLESLDEERWNLGTQLGRVTSQYSDIVFDGIEEVTQASGVSVFSSILASALDDQVTVGSDESLLISGIKFSGIDEVDLAGGSNSIVSDSGRTWGFITSAGALVDRVVNTDINAIAVQFTNVDSISNAGKLNGPSINTDYNLTSATSLSLADIDFQGVSEVIGGTAEDHFVGANLDAEWTLTDSDGQVGDIVFSGIERFSGGSANDVFNVTSGSFLEILGNGGDDTVNLDGGSVVGVYLHAGSDSVFLNSELSTANIFDGGNGTDSLTTSLSSQTWVIDNPISGLNQLGSIQFTQFENLYSTAEKVTVESGLAAVFTNSSIGFSNGLTLGYQNTGDIAFTSSFVGGTGFSGQVTANRLDIETQSDVSLESDINTLGVTAVNNTSIAVAVTDVNDLVISQINAGANGSISLNSQNFGSLTAETRGITHLTASEVSLGTTAERWTSIGEQLNPLRMDVSNTLDIVSLSYVNPEFVSSIPTITATGDRIESLSGAVASQGLKSAVQNSVVEFTQVDPAIFTDVSSYSVGVDAVYNPEGRLIAGEFIPTAATASGGDDEAKDKNSERKATAEKELTD
ncbi:MAG: beta strand repeat-containing protein, partial [Cellvibrionaceae bacterium]